MRPLARGTVGAALLLLLPAAATDAAAQCVMCGTTADAAEGSSALAGAILVLLLPALTLLGGVGFLLWRFRGADAGATGPGLPAGLRRQRTRRREAGPSASSGGQAGARTARESEYQPRRSV